MTSRFGQSRERMCHNKIGFNSYMQACRLHILQNIVFSHSPSQQPCQEDLIIYSCPTKKKKRKRDQVLCSRSYYKLVQNTNLTLILTADLFLNFWETHLLLYKTIRIFCVCFYAGSCEEGPTDNVAISHIQHRVRKCIACMSRSFFQHW